MDPFGLVSLAGIYIILQVMAVVRLEGAWLRAAILTVPVLCVILVVSVTLGLFGVQGAELGAIAAVPLGIVYLGILLPTGILARAFRGWAS